MIATFFHISVSLSMLSAHISLRRASVIKNGAYIASVILLLLTIGIQTTMLLNHRSYAQELLIIGFVQLTFVLIFSIALITFIRSMRNLTYTSEFMTQNLDKERKIMIINCLLFVIGYSLQSALFLSTYFAEINNYNNFMFLQSLMVLPGILLPVGYVIFTHYRVFR